MFAYSFAPSVENQSFSVLQSLYNDSLAQPIEHVDYSIAATTPRNLSIVISTPTHQHSCTLVLDWLPACPTARRSVSLKNGRCLYRYLYTTHGVSCTLVLDWLPACPTARRSVSLKNGRCPKSGHMRSAALSTLSPLLGYERANSVAAKWPLPPGAFIRAHDDSARGLALRERMNICMP